MLQVINLLLLIVSYYNKLLMFIFSSDMRQDIGNIGIWEDGGMC